MVYKVIGLMSGTSLDGLDLAYVEFQEEAGKWSFELKHSTTIRYRDEWFADLRNAPRLVDYQLGKLHTEYGAYMGRACNRFIAAYGIAPDLIAAHGHTVFHKPEEGFTYQLGDGQALANSCGIKTVNDFRSLDVSLGGQGAPLVPVGDRLLFADYDICLNLGGIANLSYEFGGNRIAYDISPANIALNVFANALGKEYDENGDMAASGKVDTTLLDALNALPYYEEEAPKSLSREWVDDQFMPIVRQSTASNEDKLHTLCMHIARQVHRSTETIGSGEGVRMMVTGGGAFNHFLMTCIRNECKVEITIPDKSIVEFKEAVIFAFLGVLRIRNEINCLSSVTGARKDSSCGVILNPGQGF